MEASIGKALLHYRNIDANRQSNQKVRGAPRSSRLSDYALLSIWRRRHLPPTFAEVPTWVSALHFVVFTPSEAPTTQADVGRFGLTFHS